MSAGVFTRPLHCVKHQRPSSQRRDNTRPNRRVWSSSVGAWRRRSNGFSSFGGVTRTLTPQNMIQIRSSFIRLWPVFLSSSPPSAFQRHTTLTSNVTQKALLQGVQTLLPQVFSTCSPGRKVFWNAAFSLRLTFVGRDFKTSVNQARLRNRAGVKAARCFTVDISSPWTRNFQIVTSNMFHSTDAFGGKRKSNSEMVRIWKQRIDAVTSSLALNAV